MQKKKIKKQTNKKKQSLLKLHQKKNPKNLRKGKTYPENNKTLIKEIKEDSKNGKIYSWIGRINMAKMAILPKTI